uniref:argininosuccinate synthase n=1 Tax=Stylophora pistillata TaxID=50429 RepID=A0A2B4RBQ9_STYPI
MLVEYFGDSEVLNYKSGELPKGYADLEYQADAVAEGLGKLMKHKGLILADVVGLGKTVIATRIIKEYIIKNGGDTRILIVYPNTVAHNWQSTVQNFKIKDYVHFVSNGSLQKVIEEKENYLGAVMPIEKVAYDFDEATAKLFYETMEDLIVNIVYHRYQAIHYLNAEHQKNYTNAENVAMHLYGIIKTGMVKRLESSFEAFQKSLERFCNSNGRMIEMFEKDAVMIAPDLNVNKFLDEGKEDELLEKIEKLNEQDPKNKIYKACDFREGFLEGLQKDQEILDALLEKWKKINHDPKFEKLKNDLENVFMGADNKEKKLVIFSESKETVKYLSEKLKKAGYEDVLQISSDNAQKTSTTILENFDANFDKAPKNNYNIIITTEVLAEGINLHRSNVILNYDIPWNATKLMQRIGRVNRIGTKADKILIYNFYPEKQVNEHLKLNQKALKKLQGFHATFGEDNQIYSEKEVLIKNTLGNLEAAEKETDERLLYLEIAIEVVKYAKALGADYIAHGSTGAGNDQVRFDMIFETIAPNIEIITPIRDLKLSREEEIAYLQKHGVDMNWEKSKYSINKGIWGTSVGGAETLGSKDPLPETAYPSPLKKQEVSKIALRFEKGELVAIDGVQNTPVNNILKLEEIAREYAIGRDIHIGDTIIGIKGRVGFEAAAALIIIKAHHTLEKHTLSKWQQHWKEQLANFYGMLLHEGQYLEPLMRNVEKFLSDTQTTVNGEVFVQLQPYHFTVMGIESKNDLMGSDFADYGEENNAWTSDDAKGFIKLYGMANKIFYSVNQNLLEDE